MFDLSCGKLAQTSGRMFILEKERKHRRTHAHARIRTDKFERAMVRPQQLRVFSTPCQGNINPNHPNPLARRPMTHGCFRFLLHHAFAREMEPVRTLAAWSFCAGALRDKDECGIIVGCSWGWDRDIIENVCAERPARCSSTGSV